MSVRRYGIYLAYAPTTDLRGQGLGRHLANMLRGAESRGDVRFVLACPGWLLPDLKRLFADEHVPEQAYEVITTRGMPLSLRFYLMARRLGRFGARQRPGEGWLALFAAWLRRANSQISGQIVSTRNPFYVLILLLPALVFLAASLIRSLVWGVITTSARIAEAVRLLVKHSAKNETLEKYVRGFEKLRKLTSRPQSIGMVFRLYRHVEAKEAGMLVKLINRRRDIDAWYSPTAFWPEFNQIHGPKLMCVPDVVLADFPIGFASAGDDRMLHAFTRVQAAIRGASDYVTYSEDVKWNTLARQYAADPARIHSIPHGDNSLVKFLDAGEGEPGSSVDARCQAHLRDAMRNSSAPEYTVGFDNMQFDFLFYASQFRPNKNVLTLLRAYESLLRERHVRLKLILTGNLDVMDEIRDFIKQRGLENDVLCLRGLSVRQLAACYRLARLAVNPSLSEGGFPFTFDEAVSVGTPVMMARIGVTEEVIADPDLQADMLFDPYDWQDMARKIEWALANREHLYQRQRPVYERRSWRTWSDVVDDYVKLLDEVSRKPTALCSLP